MQIATVNYLSLHRLQLENIRKELISDKRGITPDERKAMASKLEDAICVLLDLEDGGRKVP